MAHGRSNVSYFQIVLELPLDASSRRDLELVEDLGQVMVDRGSTDEELPQDFRVGHSLRSESGDAFLLSGQLGIREARHGDRSDARDCEFPGCSLGEQHGPHRRERLQRGRELFVGIATATLTPQPFPVEQPGSGDLGLQRRVIEDAERLLVVVVCFR